MFVWAFPPNWKQSFETVLRYQTSVIYSRQGKEQRIADRFEPRIGFEYQAVAKRDDFRRAQREIYTNLKDQVVVPFWPDRTTLGAAIPAGTSSFDVVEVRPWMVAGALLVLATGGKGEAHRIQAVSSSTITLETPTTSAWEAHTAVLEGFLGRLAADMSQRGYTAGLSTMDVQFNVKPGSTQPYITGVIGTVFDGKEVFEFPINWRESVQSQIQDPRKVVDFGRGGWEVFHPQDFLTITRTVAIHRDGFNAVRELEDFFRRHRGQQKEFYMPNPFVDFKATAGLVLGAQTLEIDDSEFAAVLTDDTVHRAVAVTTTDGVFYNQIENAVASGSNTVLNLRNAWTANKTLPEITKVSLLNICRFASDALTTEWQTNRVATFRPAMQTLEDHWTGS